MTKVKRAISPTMNNTCPCLILLLFLTRILLVTTQKAISTSKTLGQPFSCPAEPIAPDCSCEEKLTSQTQFHCPKTNLSMNLFVLQQLQVRVHLKCTGPEPYDFRSLQKLEIGNVSLLKVENCMLNEDQPILTTFEFLGATSVRNLIYVNFNDGIRYMGINFYGLEQLESLTLSGGEGSIDLETFSRFHNLKQLNIGHNRLNVNTFNGLRKMSNGLSYVHTNPNSPLPPLPDGLETLKLMNVVFKNLTTKFLHIPKSLRILKLRNNSIESIDTATFASSVEIVELKLSSNPFVRLPNRLFVGNKKLETLILTNNKKLDMLPEEFLANLPKLHKVHVGHNGIQRISESLLRGSANITELNFSYNKLERLPDELLSDQQRLEVIILEHNQLGIIPEHLFRTNSKLRTIDLSGNLLESLSESTFANLPDLKALHLRNNKLHSIAHTIFMGTEKLEELYLQNNRIELGTTFHYLKNLRVLHLKNNSITTISEDWFKKNLELQYLDLSFNRISKLLDTDLQFQSNISLNLSNNAIAQITLKSLNVDPNQTIKVDLNNNPLSCNCEVLEFVQHVQNRSEQTLQFATENLRCAEPRNLINTSMKQVQTKELVCDLETGCPVDCHCLMRPEDHTIVVNCTKRGLTRIPELPIPPVDANYDAIELHVEDNLIDGLPLANTPGYKAVAQLYAQNNSIRKLLPHHIPARLRLLDLSQNRLQMMDESTLDLLNRSNHLETLRLSGNQWHCDCSATHFLAFVQQNPRKISDISGERCHPSGKPFNSITVNELCSKDHTMQVVPTVVLCFVVAVLGVLVGLISLLFLRYQTEVKVWLFTHNLFLSLITEEELDKDKCYDAFISYSHLDEEFITDQLIPKLENEPMNFKTCWHVRDFMPGELIMTQIIQCIQSSRRTVIVLSKNFLESSWAKHEFRQAHVQSMEDNRVRVIVVIYEDIGDIDSLDGELKAYLKTNTYVKWGDPWFWQKLRYAMPHRLSRRIRDHGCSEIHLQQVATTKATSTAV